MLNKFNKNLLCFIYISFFVFLPQNIFAIEESNYIPCENKECNPEWGPTWTKFYKGEEDKPALIWYGGGKGIFLNIDYQPIVSLVNKFDIIFVASPVPVISNASTKGFPTNAYNKYAVNRMRQVTEYYKKKLNKPIWIGGTSSGGVRLIAILAGNEKNRQSDNYAGLIFASTYLAKLYQGHATMNIRTSSIKYKMDLPILIVQHARDLKPAQHPKLQKIFKNALAKKNSNKTELMLLTEGDPVTTTFDGGHHHFFTNKDEFGRVLSKFILDNTN
jgi:hypothetical protein